MPRLLRGWLWKGLWAGGNVTSLPPVPGECLPFGQVMDHVWAVSFFPQLSFTTNAQLLLLRHEAALLQWFVFPIFPLPKVKLTAVLYLLFHTGHHSDQVLWAFSSDIYASCRFLRGQCAFWSPSDLYEPFTLHASHTNALEALLPIPMHGASESRQGYHFHQTCSISFF